MSNKFSYDKVFFTSDCHFYHNNIIKYCDRPYKDFREMNESLIKNWNETVERTDRIFILGDFIWGNKGQWIDILEQLNGIKYLVLGNHDIINEIPIEYFKSINNVMNIDIINHPEIKSQKIVLSHYPMIVWNGSHRGSWQLFGHIHSIPGIPTEITKKLLSTQYDVGVDNNNYRPISFQEVCEKITKNGLRR